MIDRVKLPTAGPFRQCLTCGEPMDVIAEDIDNDRYTSEKCGHDITAQVHELQEGA
jgi:hypothetical protein